MPFTVQMVKVRHDVIGLELLCANVFVTLQNGAIEFSVALHTPNLRLIEFQGRKDTYPVHILK